MKSGERGGAGGGAGAPSGRRRAGSGRVLAAEKRCGNSGERAAAVGARPGVGEGDVEGSWGLRGGAPGAAGLWVRS